MPYSIWPADDLGGYTMSMEKIPFFSSSFPPGVRFHPSDEELIVHYLLNKVKSLPLPANVIADTQLYNHDPWELAKKSRFKGDEWYFFTPRDRKYPKGGRPNRTATSGYWKATGIDNPIQSSSGSRKIGVKKGLIFYIGRPPKGVKTDWIMTEYRLPETTSQPLRSEASMRLDDWVLCRIRQKGNKSKNARETSGKDPVAKIDGKFPSMYTYAGKDEILDYFSSSDYHRIASLLIGIKPTMEIIPQALSEISNKNSRGYCDHVPNSWSQLVLSSSTGQTNQENKEIDLFKEFEGDKFMNSSSNDMAHFLELYLPPLSETFLQ